VTRIDLRSRPNEHISYSGRALLVTDLTGSITGEGREGFYFENTRLLSHDQVMVDGKALKPVAASPVGGAGFLAYLQVPKLRRVPKNSVVVTVARFLDAGMRVELRIENYAAHAPACFDLAVHLAADFADILETKGKRQQSAAVAATWDDRRQELVLRYAHPQLDRAVAIRVEQTPAPVRYNDGALVVSLDLAAHQQVELQLAVEPIFDGKRLPAPRTLFDDSATALGCVRQQLRSEMPALRTTNATVARAWQTATDDLASLPLGVEPGPAAPIAGIPTYQQIFGRDMLTIGWQALLATPTIVRDALRLGARHDAGGQQMAGVRRDRTDLLFIGAQRQRVEASVFHPKRLVEAALQGVRLAEQLQRISSVASHKEGERYLPQTRIPIRLQFACRDRIGDDRALLVDDRIARVLPSLVLDSMLRAGDIFDEAVAV
jgi:hypothetical protein